VDSNGNILAWLEGFDQLCNNPENNFLFAEVNLQTAKATPVACISQDVVVHMDEWIASFSLDGSMMATGSGDGEAPAQLLVLNTQTGKTILNSDLSGLKQALKSTDGLFFIWSVDWAQ